VNVLVLSKYRYTPNKKDIMISTSLTSCTRMTQPSLLIHLPSPHPVSVVSARPRQCSVCVSHGQRLKFKTSALDHVDGNPVDSVSTLSRKSTDYYSHPMDKLIADQTSPGGSLWPPQLFISFHGNQVQ